uniref:ABC transporter domain-containing protein n=1 Tax=Zooxanthella nutricula TaxID=1333877 RepID=A0A7S2PGF0_9DINO|mmetsp:Transcript_57653/g.175590  ORF Transcript_57653/g.175590 Transcript_57653/m.175590 type:complete len:358 (+) Transcript_57653:432-1505(+)
MAVVGSAEEGKPDLSSNFGGGGEKILASQDGVVALQNVTVRTPDGRLILDQVSMEIKPGTKVGIIGPNGAGKSTLMRAIAGDVALQDGKVRIGDAVRLGYLKQEDPDWADPRQRVIDFIEQLTLEYLYAAESAFPGVKDMQPRAAAAHLLKTVNFAQERWRTPLELLSGGEARRLQLLRVLALGPNVLMLDEPTNDLDAVTVDSLERLLQPWKGTVILVSHDRSLLDGVANAMITFPREGGGPPRFWEGTYSELMEYEQRKAPKAPRGAAQGLGAAPAAPTKVLSKQERRQLEKQLRSTEADIEKVEGDLETAKAEMQEAGSDSGKVMELYDKIGKLEEEQAALYEKWETLSTELES